MAQQRQKITFSASSTNTDAQFVLCELAKLPNRERSRTVWNWAASYLRGQARETKQTPGLAEIDATVLDDIAELLGAL